MVRQESSMGKALSSIPALEKKSKNVIKEKLKNKK
jgi:hypothetical protein